MTSGLLRLLTPHEAVAARREARAEFLPRYEALMGYPVPPEEVERWWPEVTEPAASPVASARGH